MKKKFEFKYNKGSIKRPPFAEGSYGRVHSVIWSLPLPIYARAILAWADSRPPEWVPRVDNICDDLRLSEKTWASARNALVNGGWLSHKHTRKEGDQRSTHELDFDLSGLKPLIAAAAAKNIEQPPPKNGGSRARPTETEGSREPLGLGGSRDPPETEDLTTTIETTLNDHHSGGGCENNFEEARCALVAPAGAAQLLGDLLADLLNKVQAQKVNRASAGATTDQVIAAAAAVHGAVANGSAKSAVGYAMHMAKLAAFGQIESVPAPALPKSDLVADQAAKTLSLRAQKTGWSVTHGLGTLKVASGGQAWHHVGGQHDGRVVVNEAALKVWQRVEAGELTLTPPRSA